MMKLIQIIFLPVLKMIISGYVFSLFNYTIKINLIFIILFIWMDIKLHLQRKHHTIANYIYDSYLVK